VAEGRECRADSDAFVPFVGNVVEGKGILEINVSVCSTVTC
jgi:hypothetical protein